MKISLTNYEQTLIIWAIAYFDGTSFLSEETIKSFQKIIDKMSIETPMKSGQVNSLIKSYAKR